MKIELRKETKLTGIFYYVYVDDIYVEYTCTMDENEANEIYEFVKAHNGLSLITETLKSEEI